MILGMMSPMCLVVKCYYFLLCVFFSEKKSLEEFWRRSIDKWPCSLCYITECTCMFRDVLDSIQCFINFFKENWVNLFHLWKDEPKSWKHRSSEREPWVQSSRKIGFSLKWDQLSDFVVLPYYHLLCLVPQLWHHHPWNFQYLYLYCSFWVRELIPF